MYLEVNLEKISAEVSTPRFLGRKVSVSSGENSFSLAALGALCRSRLQAARGGGSCHTLDTDGLSAWE